MNSIACNSAWIASTDVLLAWEYPVKESDAADEAEVDEKTAIQYWRNVCSGRILNHDSPLLLGGPGVVIQSDESFFCHKPKEP